MIGQRLLFSGALDFAPKPRARRTDPIESALAAKRAMPHTRDHNELILGVLRAAAEPLNCYQIAGRTRSLSQVQVARRMAALHELALVVVAGTSERGRTWRLVTAQDRALRELDGGRR